MAAHTLSRDDAHQRRLRHSGRDGRATALLQLGWLHFWTLTGILGGMLALVALVFLIASRVWR
jgi:hypothetical protein